MSKTGFKKKVFVAMSGGVDSSVAAALLQKNYRATGVFMRGWEPVRTSGGGEYCDWRAERRDAMRVAAKLGISFLTFDFSREYKEQVVDRMISEYRAGQTPNPDVLCNREIKFGLFFKKARALGADFIATGHYVRLSNFQPARRSGGLLTSNDQNKDQSYFLWAIPQDILPHCLFPIGDYEKSEVRKLAKKFSLPTTDKPDSQGVCFIGELNVKDFLREHLPLKPGGVVNERGEIIGKHDGVYFYTLGERHGFTVTQPSSNQKPYYVVAKDLINNKLIVSLNPKINSFAKTAVELVETNWLAPAEIGRAYQYRARYREPLADCQFESLGTNHARIKLATARADLAPGQSFVLYANDLLLGGGIIAE